MTYETEKPLQLAIIESQRFNQLHAMSIKDLKTLKEYITVAFTAKELQIFIKEFNNLVPDHYKLEV